tara:strand:+ start:502 stop:1533 length:1032 start_codon:yes stop_codon:yes gene_type:complete
MYELIEKYPKDLGFHMPAEWSLHHQTWMMWPTGLDLDRYPNTGTIRQAHAETANLIADFEPVTIIANKQDTDNLKTMVASNVSVMTDEIDDSWCRDSGPTFITNEKEIAGIDWTFNNYGELCGLDYSKDAETAEKIIKQLNIKHFKPPIVLEGGAIHTDGNGTLMLTEDVIFDPERNSGLDKKEAEYILEKYLGVENFIWLIAALEFDDTGGHVDNLACFTPNNQIIALSESNRNDSNYDRLKENHDRLKSSKNIDGKDFEIISIQQPSHKTFLNERMPLSYINFYMVNNGIILPIFNDPMDAPATATITTLFKDKKVVTLEGSRIVEGGGCVHCITQQQPRI